MTDACARGFHNFCQADGRQQCDCPTCHHGPCPRCHATNLRKVWTDDRVCTDCYRKELRLAQVGREMRCDKCGGEHAFRNPGPRKNEFLCLACHNENGDSLLLVPGVQSLAAACRTADINSDQHDWEHLKGSCFICVNCSVRRYETAKRKHHDHSAPAVSVQRP